MSVKKKLGHNCAWMAIIVLVGECCVLQLVAMFRESSSWSVSSSREGYGIAGAPRNALASLFAWQQSERQQQDDAWRSRNNASSTSSGTKYSTNTTRRRASTSKPAASLTRIAPIGHRGTAARTTVTTTSNNHDRTRYRGGGAGEHDIGDEHGGSNPFFGPPLRRRPRNNRTVTTVDPSRRPPRPRRPHPHAGARYSNGSWGYVADVTRVRARMLSLLMHHRQQQAQKHSWQDDFSLPFHGLDEMSRICQTNPGEGAEGSCGWELLTERVVVDGPDPTATNAASTAGPSSPLLVDHRDNDSNNAISNATDIMRRHNRTLTGKKILCAIYTHGKNYDKVQGITETWGWRCDGFFAASTITIDDDPDERGYGAIDLPHAGQEDYKNMWQKTRSILCYMYDHYLRQYEYFFLSGDDTYVIVENLRNVLQSIQDRKPPHTPLYLGSDLPGTGHTFAGGGAGYVLNRFALKRLVEGSIPICLRDVEGAAEDRFLGLCLHSIGINVTDTTDALGKQRFQNMDPDYLATHPAGKGRYFKLMYEHWAKKHGPKYGRDIVSSQTVSFHALRTPVAMKRVHAILYKSSCPRGSVLGDALS